MLGTMRTCAALESSALKRSRPAGGPVLAPSRCSGSMPSSLVSPAGLSDTSWLAPGATGSSWPWPLPAPSSTACLPPRAQRRWRAVLASAFGGLAAGVALTAALSSGDHTLAELESALGVPLPTVSGLPAAYAGLAAIRIGAIAIAAGLLAALVLRTVGVISGVTALELEAVVGLPVWLVVWRRTAASRRCCGRGRRGV